ncbi:hypothetical protein GCM10009864_74860 [Streptomyces lunalinharesii]|uniref:Uncharacterized protein n=1 Tax=Streptomyces lunalinharesii TaxID=333384 RepID=A0ABN3SZW2_9ACTN
MVKMGRVALDGTKLEVNTSRHKAMSYGRPVEKEERIEAEIAELVAEAAALTGNRVDALVLQSIVRTRGSAVLAAVSRRRFTWRAMADAVRWPSWSRPNSGVTRRS